MRVPSTHPLRIRFCLNIGWLYTRLVASYSYAPEIVSPGDEDDDSPIEETPLLSRAATTKLNNSIQEFMAMLVPRRTH